ncbi:MAG TPA: glucosamine-6-phosphate deaminase [Gemmatales bacterium]|nr:glucosamine-6-phosphate deaminase [Gemmatales bacterium]
MRYCQFNFRVVPQFAQFVEGQVQGASSQKGINGYTFGMKIAIAATVEDMGRQAADEGAEVLCKAIESKGAANLILATGASQFTVLDALLKVARIAWNKVTIFHLDEYLGLPPTHSASFRKYLRDRFVSKLSMPPAAVQWIDGQSQPEVECHRLSLLIMKHPIDLAFIGIGENGHLAFNDPPADFITRNPYIVVQLDEACRKQQLGEGWFPTFEDIPQQAISMSINQIMKSQHIICSVPDERKAIAVKNAVEGPVTNVVPASILKNHPSTTLFLDVQSAKLLSKSNH